MLVITIQGSFSNAKKQIQEANKKGDIIELRLDLLDDLKHLAKLKGFCLLPVIFTLRKCSQGGQFSGNAREQEEKILELLALNPDYVDLEYDCDLSFFKAVQSKFPKLKIICSFHDFEKTPQDLNRILSEMKKKEATIYKLATYARSSLDSLRMLVFVKNQQDVAGMCMGEDGVITRILSPIVKSLLTYTYIDQKSASGQIQVDVLEKIYHFSQLNQQTEIYALIGDPVDKSIGHFVHNRIYEKLNINGVYVKFSLTIDQIREFFSLIKKLPFKGFSVTMPLKEKIGMHLEVIDPLAKKIGAVNTLAWEGRKWKGFNTDAAGALDAIEAQQKVRGKKVVILGAGGAARALAFESIERGGIVLILNRTEEKAKKLAHQLGCAGGSLYNWPIDSFDVLMNTTSVGMKEQFPKSLIPEEMLFSDAVVFDAVMSLKETDLLHLAKRKGCTVVYGYEMFSRQAIKQIELWFKRSFKCEKFLEMIEQIYHREYLV